MGKAIPVEQIDDELEELGIPRSYQNRRRLARAMQIQLHHQPTDHHLKRIYKADSQRSPGKQYTVVSDENGVTCTCPDAKKGNVCKHALQVMRWEAGFVVKNLEDVESTSYPIESFTVAIPNTGIAQHDEGIRVVTIRAEDETTALAAAIQDPDKGIIIVGEESEYELCPNDQPVVRTTADYKEQFPDYVFEGAADGDMVHGKGEWGTPYDAEFMYGNNRLGH